MHHVATACSVDENVDYLVLPKQISDFIANLRIVIPIVMPQLDRDRYIKLPILSKRFHAIKILRRKIVVHLQKRHAHSISEMRCILGEQIE